MLLCTLSLKVVTTHPRIQWSLALGRDGSGEKDHFRGAQFDHHSVPKRRGWIGNAVDQARGQDNLQAHEPLSVTAFLPRPRPASKDCREQKEARQRPLSGYKVGQMRVLRHPQSRIAIYQYNTH